MSKRPGKTVSPSATAAEQSFERALLNTAEVAELLRMSPRTIYHLVSRGEIPFGRARGKLLFERHQIEAWIAASTRGPALHESVNVPPVIAGSHDPLLDWAVREAGSVLALDCHGSSDGLARLASRRACAALIHIPNSSGTGYNTEAIQSALAGLPVVSLHWARREQGLIVAEGNPLRIRSLKDLIARRARVIRRQPGAGSNLLFARLLRASGASLDKLRALDTPAFSETEVAEAIADGYADAGFGIRAVADRHRLPFIPLATEDVELVAWRRSVFDPPLHRLLELGRGRRFAAHAGRLGGYDLTRHGQVCHNG
ncbi:MAG: helix-turn-helix domain-containing protein [Betaproteobacteria bacterium]|nr:helix-turn-helix domain-containing protein [Betaproteobacteria bacterium]